jgi:NAD(P)-dependent dehydrogenase (short-subunit alcohol dehydrogenase family)
MEIAGARALVTGGASGIGYAVAEELLRGGARVFIVDIAQDALDTAAAKLRESTGGQVEVGRADVSSVDDMALLGTTVREAFGGLDILVNNAGVVYHAKPLWETAPEMVDWSFAVNVTGVINGVREFVPGMIEQHHGHVVNTASMAGFQVRKFTEWFQGLYAATKFSVVAISEALRQDLEEYGIGVSVLAPAAVDTNISNSDAHRPDRFGGATTGSSPAEHARALAERGMPPSLVAKLVVDAIITNRLYLFTHVKDRAVVAERTEGILAGFDESAEVLKRLDPSWIPAGGTGA